MNGNRNGNGSGRTAGVTGVNLLALRSHNGALVLDLLRGAGTAGISRLELAERTGLTPQAVSKITARLRADGLLTEAGYRASTGGKPRTVLRLVPDAGHAVGLHLDRDELTAVLCDLTGTVVAERRAPLNLGAGADAVVEGAAREVEALLAGASEGRRAAPVGAAPDPYGSSLLPVLGVGVALPGPLDHLHGVLHRVTGFPEWDGFPLRAALARRLGMPVVVDKDTNAAALGLAAVAGAHGSFAYLHLGTGLGAGLVIDGAVHRGARTRAGEFGHQVVQLDGPLCECGNRGCIEVLCLAAVARGDTDEAARVLGAGVANLVGLLDIELVLLGGRTVEASPDAFVRGVGFVLDEWARRQGEDPAVPVRVASGGRSAVAEGAAQLLLAPLFGRADG
ncbi:ROK family transcriptional regulator [Streptomyces europaeiscabiei]|uniref:ROK family transcriptional regulator n=2 Tax=Streptomyces europaeiscabiei TaxID=146819 RepID=UPI0029BBA470|nr:ROK family transcriptional regulator [Streptomyces europaeiscabiei]MDX3583908.1 ROK family transcriptional regulator [Streptomyces europaeiscabiei]MDX3629653.1 ROK family transcriptional regulator [Streptomyces europaeiscabiei]MDX3648270.1 ROK family transcriptional regulator [Streptomyces europaeiscabiei]